MAASWRIGSKDTIRREGGANSHIAQMQRRGMEPSVVTYSALISACGKGRDLKKALELFAQMQRRGLQLDVITFNALISVCGKACKPEKALELFAELQRRGLQPGVITYAAACSPTLSHTTL